MAAILSRGRWFDTKSTHTTWNYDDNISSRLNTWPISTHNEAIVSQEITSKMHRISFRLTTKVSRAPVDNNETFMKGLGMSCNMQGLHLGLIGRFFIAPLLLSNLWPTIVPKHCIHDDVIKWKHFLCYWPFVRGIHRSPLNSPHKVQWRGALMLSLICAWTNSWVSNREAGDLRRHRAHYDVVVMLWTFFIIRRYRMNPVW